MSRLKSVPTAKSYNTKSNYHIARICGIILESIESHVKFFVTINFLYTKNAKGNVELQRTNKIKRWEW